MDTARLHDEWKFQPAFTAEESVEDFALAVRGRVSLGRRVVSLPWRLANIQDLPAVDAPAQDGVVPRLAGPEGVNGEFDTPIDPRFPTFLATNLSKRCPVRSRPHRHRSPCVACVRAASVLPNGCGQVE